jgi:lipopolysaccharide transport system ATP-binding protein
MGKKLSLVNSSFLRYERYRLYLLLSSRFETMNSPLIIASNLSKTYLLYPSPAHRLWQMCWRGRRQFYTPFEALKPLSFTIHQGETVGIVGKNGSGKSTLLQLLAGTLSPTSGTLAIRGKVAALLELGAGFSPEFTGRENVLLNAGILGMSQTQIEAAYPDIIAFAGIGEFIHRPVSTYSSGMVVRLAFAVATAAQPDILIVDEALSVGDEAFQRKCFARIEQMKAAGATILFVSHSAQTIVQLCDRAIWLDAGQMRQDGSPKAVLDAYHKALHAQQVEKSPEPEKPRPELLAATAALMPSESLHEYPAQGGKITNIRLTTATGENIPHLEHGQRYRLQYDLAILASVKNLRCGMFLKTRTGVEAAGAVLHLAEHDMPQVEAGANLTLCFDFTCLLYAGNYFLNCGVMGEVEGEGEERYLHRLVDAFSLQILNPTKRNRHGVSPEGLVDLDVAADFTISDSTSATD